ncbi:MAG: hypothetical protein SYC29_02785 [Planctomycetota bacterium]|nr:hypothetical protein [Planctomycetota bacterium]
MKAMDTVRLALLGGLLAIALSAPAHAGACILEETECIDVPQEVCEALGGEYMGDETDCDTWRFEPLPEGACCFEDPDEDCQDLTEPACFAAGGVWSGPGSDCDWIECTGACCLFDGTCEQRTRLDCESIPGAKFMGNDISCDSVVCRVVGACCLPSGSCQESTADECHDLIGGVYQGWQTECQTTVCTGACCVGGCPPSCVPDVTWDDCETAEPDGLGGHFLGYGSTCDEGICLALVEEQSYSFVQSGGDRVFNFEKFDDLGKLRSLERVTIEVSGQVILVAILDNRGNDNAIESPSLVTETVAVNLQDLLYFPDLFSLIDVADFEIVCPPPPFLVLPGAFCAFESPYLFPDPPPAGLAIVRDANEGLEEFVAASPGDTFQIILIGEGRVTNEGIGEGAINRDPHIAEGLIKVTYEYEPAFTCDIIGPDELCPLACDEYIVDIMNMPDGAPPPTYEWFISGDGYLPAPCDGAACEACGEDTCDGSFVLTVEVSVGELCAMCEKEVFVGDGTPPDISCPANEEFQCEGEIPPPAADLEEFIEQGGSVSDNCPGEITVEWLGDSDLSDPCGGTVERTYRATDHCGIQATCIQTFTVNDTIAPEIFCPPEDQYECEDDLSLPAANLAEFEAQGGSVSDNCPGPITLTCLGDSDLTDPCGGTIDRTYEARDQCNNAATCVQTFTIDDETPPQIDCPPDETYECEEDIPDHATNLAEFEVQGGSVSDNCPGPITLTWLGDSDLTDPCGGMIERRYEARDQCGNTATCIQIITIDDQTPPDITCPDDATFECEGDIPPPAEDLAEFEGQGGSATDNCDGPIEIVWLGDSDLTDPCGGTIERQYQAIDQCDNASEICTQTFTIDDTTPPELTCPPDKSYQCEEDVPAAASDLDDFVAQGGSVSDNCDGPITIIWLGDTDLSDPCGGTIERTYEARDQCSNAATCVQTITVNDTEPPECICPPDQNVGSWDDIPAPNPDDVTCTDNCGPCDVEWVSDVPDSPQECPFTMVRTYRCIDECDNESTCEQRFICGNDHPGCDEKGSLVVFSKVEIRWDAGGNLLQDTFIQLTNDYPGDVWVKMYFINGDEPLEETADERAHLGWNWTDVTIQLTGNQPVYWSALTGLPANGSVSPFTILDPGDPPGRPAMDGTTDRVLRGYILAWAVNIAGTDEIKWNHLAGNGTLVHYGHGTGWEYKACAFQVVDTDPDNPWVGHGEPTGTPGVLNLDGIEYDRCYDVLLMNFQAAESAAFSQEGVAQTISDTDLTLHPVSADLRQNNDGPLLTKADFTVRNQWESQFGTHRCIVFWDQTLLSLYGIPNVFLVDSLQTDHGSALIDGVAGEICDLDLDGDGVPDIIAEPAALLGLSARMLTIDGGQDFSTAGTSLFGFGAQGATIRYDPDEDVPGVPGLPPNPTKEDLRTFLDAFIKEYGDSRQDR